PAYRLIQEYFAFPEKYHFFDLAGLKGRASGPHIDILFLLDRAPKSKLAFTPDTFSLGCTPIVNLFRKTSEPIRVDHRQLEYRLLPDLRKEKTTEIPSIVSVSGASDPAEGTRDYAPFYSFTHPMERHNHKAYWHARRVQAQNPELTGTDMLL